MSGCQICPACGKVSLSSVREVGSIPAKSSSVGSEPLAASLYDKQSNTKPSSPYPKKGRRPSSSGKKRSSSSHSSKSSSPDTAPVVSTVTVAGFGQTKTESPEEFYSFSENEEQSDTSENRIPTIKSKFNMSSITEDEDNDNMIIVSAGPCGSNQSNVIELSTNNSTESVAIEEPVIISCPMENSVKIPRSDESLPIRKQSSASSVSSASPPPLSSKQEKSKIISQRSFSTGDTSVAVMPKREDTTDGGESDASASSSKRQTKTKGLVDALTAFFTPTGKKRACTLKKEGDKSESNQNTDNEKSESSGPGSHDGSPSAKKKPASVKARKVASAPATISEDSTPVPASTSSKPIKPPKVRLSSGSSTASNVSTPSKKKSVKSSMESLLESPVSDSLAKGETSPVTPGRKLSKLKKRFQEKQSLARTEEVARVPPPPPVVDKTQSTQSKSPVKKPEVSSEADMNEAIASVSTPLVTSPLTDSTPSKPHKRKGRRPTKGVIEQQRTITDFFRTGAAPIESTEQSLNSDLDKPATQPGRPKKRKLSEPTAELPGVPTEHSSGDTTDKGQSSVMDDVLSAVISPPKKKNKMMRTPTIIPVEDMTQVSTEVAKRTSVESAIDGSEQVIPSQFVGKKKGKVGKKSVIEILKTTKKEDSAAEADDEAEFEGEVVRSSVKKIKTKRLSDSSLTPSPSKSSNVVSQVTPSSTQDSTQPASSGDSKSPKSSSPKKLSTVESPVTVSSLLPAIQQTPQKKSKKKDKSTPVPSTALSAIDEVVKNNSTPVSREASEPAVEKKIQPKKKKSSATPSSVVLVPSASSESLLDNFDVKSDSSANSKSSLTLDCGKVAMLVKERAAKVGGAQAPQRRKSLSPEKKLVKSPSPSPSKTHKLPKTPVSTSVSSSPAPISSPPAVPSPAPVLSTQPISPALKKLTKLKRGPNSGKAGSPPKVRPKRTLATPSVSLSTPVATEVIEIDVDESKEEVATLTVANSATKKSKKSKVSVLVRPAASAMASGEKLKKRAKSLSAAVPLASEITTPSVKTAVKSKQLVLTAGASEPEGGERRKKTLDRDSIKIKKLRKDLMKTPAVLSPVPVVESSSATSSSTKKLKKGEKVLQPKAKNTTPMVTSSRSDDESSGVETGVPDSNVQKCWLIIDCCFLFKLYKINRES